MPCPTSAEIGENNVSCDQVFHSVDDKFERELWTGAGGNKSKPSSPWDFSQLWCPRSYENMMFTLSLTQPCGETASYSVNYESNFTLRPDQHRYYNGGLKYLASNVQSNVARFHFSLPCYIRINYMPLIGLMVSIRGPSFDSWRIYL